ncbi:hypothetical protein [Desulforhopalus sp. IMCC35007]|uniref:hypothetical protein n=1 Tax=Desulforhopalus sp. IMCC35007 TaxID=2569543 RepID=UPI0010AEB3D1|nr:hypothetical protein [Desulforhopalus sp. IMCC35007]TKB11781.1 hypothetical protein FCL48_03015 [Desulforhopalus sp. IMCC35007]
MKYAFIVMLAVYLVTFGCNPKPEAEHSTPQEKTEQVSVEKAPEAPAAPENVHVVTKVAVKPTTPQAGPENHWNTNTSNTQEETAVQPGEAQATPPAQVEEEPANPYKAIAQSAAVTLLALMNDNSEPKAEAVEPQPAKTEVVVVTPAQEETIEQEAVVILPCGKVMERGDFENLPPCFKHGAPLAEQPAVPGEAVELSAAMQKMVNATNDMVTVTRELVIATQQILAASKDVAVELIDTGKEAIETSKPAVENAIDEKKIIETVKGVVSATKEAFETTSEALSKALEAKEAAPVEEVTPQQ